MSKSELPQNLILPPVSQSYWMASVSRSSFPRLEENITAEVAIVGGGITGITLAYLLKKKGLKAVILEADKILQGATGHTTAKITSQHSLVYDKISSKLGNEMARQYADANEAAIHMIEDIIADNKIECDFKHLPAYVYTQLDEYVPKLESEARTAADLGICAFYTEELKLPFKVKAAMRFDNQAQFHPLRYAMALASKIPGDGCAIYEQTRAIDIEEGERNTVVTHQGARVTADFVVLASHYPFWDRHGLYFSRLYPERSYALGVTIAEKFPEGMYITAEDPGRSLRAQPYGDGELVIIGGEHHKTGHGENTHMHYERLRDFAHSNFTVHGIPYRWSTQDYTSMDEIPQTGRITSNRPNIFVATGFMKWGMTNSTASAAIIRDLIVKGESPWQDVYNPSRFTPAASAKNFIVENADVAKNYISGKLAAIDKDIDILPGQARIIEHEGSRSGAYRDEKGKLHIVDTKCTHIGCELHWNEAEMTWDCPCHGSRFTYEGEIVDGPALRPLKPHHLE